MAHRDIIADALTPGETLIIDRPSRSVRGDRIYEVLVAPARIGAPGSALARGQSLAYRLASSLPLRAATCRAVDLGACVGDAGPVVLILRVRGAD